jgi:hypothetical protein
MGEMDAREDVKLDRRVPLFRHLAAFGELVDRRGRTIRLVGGAAMLLWGHLLHRPRDLTGDLDCALLDSDVPDAHAAEQLASETLKDLHRLGFLREKDWRRSRTGRFSYTHLSDPVAIEFLCGEMAVGRSSRRKPAWQLASTSDGPPHFYAARVPWLDLVAEWVAVRVQCGRATITARIPDLASLAVLKIRAVADKVERVEKERMGDRLTHEKLRLFRHATDCSHLFIWIDEVGQFDRLARLGRKHPRVLTVAREVAIWILEHPELAEELFLFQVGRDLERLV